VAFATCASLADALSVVSVAETMWRYGDMCEDKNVQDCCQAGECGTQNWGVQFPICNQSGTQSPINLPYKAPAAMDISLSDLAFTQNAACSEGAFTTTLTAGKVQVAGVNCTGQFATTFMEKVYTLEHLEFHSPSEHTLDGKYFPMEVQYVHKAADGEYLVVGVLVTSYRTSDLNLLGVENPLKKSSNYLAALLKQMPSTATTTQGVIGAAHASNGTLPSGAREALEISGYDGPYDFIPAQILNSSAGFFTYEGSLTTPPCTGGVRWIISALPAVGGEDSMTQFRGDLEGIVGNRLEKRVEPDFDDDAWEPEDLKTKWNANQGVNNRPIQALTGIDGPARGLYRVTGDALALQEPGSSINPMQIGMIVIAALLVLVLVIVAAMCCGKSKGKGKVNKYQDVEMTESEEEEEE